jgi:hypothetical protein
MAVCDIRLSLTRRFRLTLERDISHALRQSPIAPGKNPCLVVCADAHIFLFRTSGKIQDYGIDSCTPAKGESLELGAGNRWFTGVVRRRILNGVCPRHLLAREAHAHLCNVIGRRPLATRDRRPWMACTACHSASA